MKKWNDLQKLIFHLHILIFESMENFSKYLTSGEMDKQWGIYLTVAGRYKSLPTAAYPSKEHPTGYYFDWETGRTLDEYQLNYITEGYGAIETEAGAFKIQPGTMMVISPGMKHRYRPDPSTGWIENYIGFKGKVSGHFMKEALKGFSSPVISCGGMTEIFDVYQKVFDLVQMQKPAYQQIASGMIIKLLGFLISSEKQSSFRGKQIEDLITSARAYMWEHVNKEADLHVFAKNHLVSYSYFRRMFKLYTGIAPHSYYLDLKIMRAKELIITSEKSIKEITYELGFDSIHYFSRLFKKKTGTSPNEHRRRT